MSSLFFGGVFYSAFHGLVRSHQYHVIFSDIAFSSYNSTMRIIVKCFLI